MNVNEETRLLAISKGYKECTCSCGGYPSCICEGEIFNIRQDELQKWLRENYNVHIVIDWCHIYEYHVFSFNAPAFGFRVMNFKTYESCLEEAIDKALNLI